MPRAQTQMVLQELDSWILHITNLGRREICASYTRELIVTFGQALGPTCKCHVALKPHARWHIANRLLRPLRGQK